MPTTEDRVESARLARERAEREAVKRHSAREPSDPPPPSSTRPSFRVGVAHFAGWAERMSKRVTVLVALVSAAGVMGSAGLSYWTSKQDFARQSQLAEINASLRRIELSVQSMNLGDQNAREQIKLINETLWQHTQQLASLSAPGKNRSSRQNAP